MIKVSNNIKFIAAPRLSWISIRHESVASVPKSIENYTQRIPLGFCLPDVTFSNCSHLALGWNVCVAAFDQASKCITIAVDFSKILLLVKPKNKFPAWQWPFFVCFASNSKRKQDKRFRTTKQTDGTDVIVLTTILLLLCFYGNEQKSRCQKAWG